MLHRFKSIPALMLMVALLSGRAAAQQEPAQVPIVEPQMFLLIKIELAQVNPPLLEKWVVDRVGEMKLADADKQQLVTTFKQGFAQMSKAIDALVQAGAQQLYVAAGISDLESGPPPVFITMDPAGIPDLVATIIYSGRPDGPRGPDPAAARGRTQIATPFGQGVFFGQAQIFQRMQAGNRGGNPQLTKAMSELFPGTAQAVFLPSADLIAMFEKDMPTIPEPVNMPMTTLTKGIKSASLVVQAPPGPSAKLVILASDAATAAQLKDLIDRLVPVVASMIKTSMPDLDAQPMIDAIKPTVEASQVVVLADESKLKALVAGPLLASLQQGRASAVRAQSAAMTRQVVMQIAQFASQNGGKWPDTIEQAGIPPQLLRNPRGINDGVPGYIYVTPAAGTIQGAGRNTILIYENPAALRPADAAMINVGFTDGHVETMPAAVLQQRLNAAPAPR